MNHIIFLTGFYLTGFGITIVLGVFLSILWESISTHLTVIQTYGWIGSSNL